MLLTGTVLTGMLTAHGLSAARASDGIPSPLASGGIPSSAETIAPVEPREKGEQVSEEKLPNGMTFIYQGRPGCGTYAITLATTGGSFEDPDEHLGLTNVLAEMLLRGTPSRSGPDLARQVERTGSSLAASGGMTAVELQAVGPAAAFGEVFDILADAARHPLLATEDLSKEIALEQQALRTSLDNPSSELMRTGRPVLFRDHKLGRVPNPETYLQKLDIEPLRAAYRKRFVGQRLVVVIVGEVEPAAARQRVTAAFGDLEPGIATTLPFPRPEPLREEPRARARRRTSQPELLVAMPTAGVADEDEPAMDLLSNILGGFQERLSTRLREERGWAYWVSVAEWRFPGMGLFGVQTAVPKRHLDDAEKIIREELHRISTEPPSPEEVERARRFTLTELARAWQQSLTRAAAFATAALRGRPPRGYEERVQRYGSVTPEAIRDLARRLLESSRLAVVTLY